MKKFNIILRICLVLLIISVLLGCAKEDNRKKTVLSLDKVIELSEKGNDISWNDFEDYESEDIGSGIYVLRYEIDSRFYLIIGGSSKDEKPMYVRLVKMYNSDDYIDIRTDDVNDFIS